MMVARLAEANGKWNPDTEGDIRGTVVFIGSIISQGNRGQVAYAASKKALEAVAARLTKEGMSYGVRFGVVHPGYTDTPMVQAVPQEIIKEKVLPSTQLKRLITPDEIADTVCFMISNSCVTKEIWVDAGWHPMA
jgi:NAD(P)-dependent dehydrogenase (short-subunit alcohol dehydrogenase family)